MRRATRPLLLCRQGVRNRSGYGLLQIVVSDEQCTLPNHRLNFEKFVSLRASFHEQPGGMVPAALAGEHPGQTCASGEHA
jgi:hypothetical protein